MKQIVILGGGFAGVATGLRLRKKLSSNQATITLIDRNSFHVFTPSLYEVATSEQPKQNIAIPFKEIFGESVQLKTACVEKIEWKKSKIVLQNDEKLPFDYLVLALGSEPAYFAIPGLKEYSLPLKSVEDALQIRNTIKEQYHKRLEKQETLRVVIGGGGFSGTELAAEMIDYRNRLIKHHQQPIDSITISIVQGSECLLKELDKNVSLIAQKRLGKYGITMHFGSHIKQVDSVYVHTDNGKKYLYDVLIWTGGIKTSSIVQAADLPLTERGQILVDNNLRVSNMKHIFACGDSAGFMDPKTQKSTPQVAQVAEEQGRVVGENVYRSIVGKPLIKYYYRLAGYVVPLKGQYAVATVNKFYFGNIFGWFVQQAIMLWYLLNILPLSKALKRWNKFEMYLMK